MNVYPTGTCFDDVGEMALDYQLAGSSFSVCHGILQTGPGMDGFFYAHAWLESNGEVWQAGIIDGSRAKYAVDSIEFYEQMRVVDFIAYEPKEFFRLWAKHDHRGPFVELYRRHTNDGKRVIPSAIRASP